MAAVAPRYLPASFARRAVASRDGCFALARRSCFCRRLARFLALSLPLLCPISRTFARFSSKSKASDWDKPTCPSSRQGQGSKVVGATKISRILYWRQVVSALVLITFTQEGYYFLEAIPVKAIEASPKRYPAGIWVNHEIVLDERH